MAVVAGALACFAIRDPDLGFHVATGRAIDALGAVPTTNVLSFTCPDAAWWLHQWIPAWLFHRADLALGPAGIGLLKVAVVALTFACVGLVVARRSSERAVAVIAVLLLPLAASPRFLERPLLFSKLGLAVLLLGLTRLPEPNADRATWFRFGALTVLPAAVLAAFHAGFVYAWLVALAVLAAELLTRGSRVRPLLLWLVALVGGTALSLSLAHPFGARVLALPFRFSLDAYWNAHLVEFRPIDWDPWLYPAFWLLILLSLASLLFAARPRWTFDRVLATLLLVGFGGLVLRHQRAVYAFALVAAFALPRVLTLVLSMAHARVLRPAALALAACAALRGVVVWYGSVQPGLGLDARAVPTALLDFVATSGLPERAYVSDAWAGHWLWRFYPTRRSFYDNRIEAYPRDFFREVYQSIRYGEPGWRERLQDYDVRLVVMRYATPGERRFLEGRPGLRRLLLEAVDWRLVYWDDHGEVFVRRDVGLDACSRCGDFRSFDPDTARPIVASPGQVQGELEDVLARSGPSERAFVALVRTALWAEDRPTAARWVVDGLRRLPESEALLQLARALTGSR